MNNHQTRFGDVPLHIGGEAYPSASEQWIEVTDPADQSLLARVRRPPRRKLNWRCAPPTTPICCGGRCRPPSEPG